MQGAFDLISEKAAYELECTYEQFKKLENPNTQFSVFNSSLSASTSSRGRETA